MPEATVQTAASNGTGQQQQWPSLKVVVNKTHVGPVSKRAQRGQQLSKAANKIRLNSDLKVTRASTETRGEKAKSSYSEPITNGDKPLTPGQALVLMEVWDRKYGTPGTKSYQDKSLALSKARSEAYAELGITHDPAKKKRPVLTEEQRQAYNAYLLPYAFDYWEIRLSWKDPGKKAVRSSTYRTAVMPDIKKVIQTLLAGYEDVSKNLKIQG